MLSDLIAFCRVITSSVAEATKAVLFNVDTGDPGTDAAAAELVEQSIGTPAYGALGVIVRPRPAGADGQVENLSFRTGDGFVPFAYRDLRLNAVYSAPKPGSVALVGYGGGFHSIEDTPDGTSLHVIYAPYAYSGGIPTKAHVITIDTTAGNESVSLVHGEGQAIDLTHDKKIVLSVDAATFLCMEPGLISLQAAKTCINGNLAAGNVAAAAFMLPGTGFLGSACVAVSPA